jgi:hypothetical protein
MRRFDAPTFGWGLVFVAIGVGAWLEAEDVWALDPDSLRLVGPILILVVGVMLFVTSLGRRSGG